MVPLITIRSQFWVRVLILLGIPLLGIAGVYTTWLAIRMEFEPLLLNIIYVGAGLFCIVAVVKALPLLRYLRHTLTLYDEGIKISTHRKSEFYAWENIGSINSIGTYQMFSVHDQNGRLLYAIDYYAENFKEFIRMLNIILENQP